MTELNVRFVLRNDSTENWTAVEDTAILLKGEVGVEFTEGAPRLKVGDGTSPWKNLPYVTSANELPENFTWGNLFGTTAEGVAGETATLKLKKPAYSDKVDVAILNENADIVEEAVVDIKNRVDTANSRVDTLVSSFTDNAEFDNAELVDVRVGYDGTVHTSAGDAVRAIGYSLAELKNDVSDFIDADAVNGLLYEGNKLYLTANGVVVCDPVEIVGGSGGSGTGGGGSTYIISLLNLLDSRILSVAKGDKVEIKFDYASVDSEDYPDGPGIGYIYVNNVRKVTQSIPQGACTFDITDYLQDGANTVKVQVENSEGTSKILAYTINVLALSVTTTYSAMDLYAGAVGFPYTVSGQGTKIVHFILDGRELGTESVESTGRSRVYSIPVQSDGAHNLEVYAEVEVEGILVRSNTLKVGMMWYSNEMTEQAVLINFDRTSATQGETLTIPYMAYDPFTEDMEVVLSIIDESGTTYSTKTITIDQTPKTWVTQDYPAGDTVFKIACGSASKSITINVAPSTFNLEVIKDSLALEFSANGRSNAEANPESWSYGDVSATFSGFGWAGADGWVEDDNGQAVLRFLPNNVMQIPFKPFASDFRTSGYTIEAELATHNVRDYDSVVVSSVDNGRGFVIKSQQASLNSELSGVSIQFKEDERVRIAFVVEQKNLNRFVYIYINGVMCGVTQYADNDNFGQTTPVGITIGCGSCGLDLYVLRFYNKGFTRAEQLNNFICDRPTLAARIEAEKRNDILDESDEVSISTLPMTIPYLIMECEELPQFKGDKKKGKDVTYVDPMNPEYSFTASGVQFDVQGTSSAGYPVKNYKVAFKSGLTYTNSGDAAEGFTISPGSLVSKTLCLKADYASSENANNVMLVDYYEQTCPFKMPPQEADGRVRQGILGKPIVVFWHNTETGEVSFVGKYNCNCDKSCENIFGFDRDTYPQCECWEIRNNTSNRVIFKSSDYSDGWLDDFEARFPDTDPAYTDYTQLKRLTDWLVQTDRSAVSSSEEKAARLQKFADEFCDYLDKEACIFYYIFTEVFLMVDNRAKNMFLTTFDGEHWFPIPYDFDTAIGINNEGTLAFEYDLEDTDTVGGADVFNGQQSVLWCNLRDAFASEIANMYVTLRSAGSFNYESIRDKMKDHQSVWPEALWNEDAFTKYLQPYLLKGVNHLEMLQGDKQAQRDWWLFNGFRYRDSKYQCGDAQSKYITLRCYEVGNIELTPYSHIWPRIKFGSATVTKRGKKNEKYTMECPLDAMNDTEVYIYSADRIADIGDLSHLKVGLAEFSMATKLQSILLGSSADGYENTKLFSLDVGNNELLTTVNVENCTALVDPVDLSGCHGLETFKAKGSALTGVNLPNGGHLKTLELPATIANLTIQNQKGIETLALEGYSSLTTLRIENTPNVPLEEIINNASSLGRVRLTGVKWNATSEDTLQTTITKLKSCIGMDAIGNNTTSAVVSGRVYVDSISNEFLEEINDTFPELIVVVDGVAKFFVRYVNYNNTLLYRYIIDEGQDVIDPIKKGYITKPTRENTDDATFEYSHWSELPKNVNKPYNIIARYKSTYRVQFCNSSGVMLNEQWIEEGNAATEPVGADLIDTPTKVSTEQYNFEFDGWDEDYSNITGPLTLMPVFKEILRDYPVYFYSDTQKLQESRVYYGHTVTFTGDTSSIKKIINGVESPYYEFTGWSPNPDIPITGVTYYWAQFAFDGYIEDDWDLIADNVANGDLSTYGVGGRKKFDLTLGNTTYNMEAEIVGMNHDTLAVQSVDYNDNSEKAGLSFLCYDLLGINRVVNGSMKSYNGKNSLNAGGWSLCDLRTWMQGELFDALPPEMQDCIKTVIKTSDLGYYTKGLTTTEDKLWTPSDAELNGENTDQVVAGQGTPYSVFTNAASRAKRSDNGAVTVYWTRSSGITNMHFFRYVDTQGNVNNNGAGNPMGICFGFCI